MDDVWQFAHMDKETFTAAASLFAAHTQQQSVHRPPLLLPNGDDDSSCEEDNEDNWKTTIPCEKLHQATGNSLKDKFLDRLSEVLAREKTANAHQKQSAAKHVAAAAWVNCDSDSPTTILLAKNNGLDERDRALLKRLQTWLRAISATGKPPAIAKDTIWIGSEDKEGLVEYSRCRLEFYVSQIRQCRSGDGKPEDGALAPGRLQHSVRLCNAFDKNTTTHALGEMVDLAYELRCMDWRYLERIYGTKVIKAVLMLGRIRVAYECFKTTALSVPDLILVEIKSAESPDEVGIEVTRFRKQLRSLAEKFGHKRLVKKYISASRLHVHAEMQILANLETQPKWRQSIHDYIGASKRSCFLCHEFFRNYVRLSANGLRTPAFRARLSHGKVYPLWTLPPIPVAADPSVRLSITAALIQTHGYILQSLSDNSAVLQPAIAESSAGMSQSTAYVGGISHKLKREHLARERDANSCPPEDNNDFIFGLKVKTVQVLQLSADGSRPKLVPIAFHALPPEPSRKIPELGFDLAPDFRKYWGFYHADRKFRPWSVEKHLVDGIEGNYWIYRNENQDLPENAYVKRMLSIDRIDPSRSFYHGDVFIVKYIEHTKPYAYTVLDMPKASFLERIALVIGELSNEWNTAYLESELERDQYFEANLLKLESDKEILYQRMTPVERELLERMPPNTLEWLAMHLCDDDALVSTNVTPSSETDMVKIQVVRRPKVLDLMGWKGFESSQL